MREITGNEFDDEVSNLLVTTERVAVLLPRGIQKKKYINRDEIKSGSQTSMSTASSGTENDKSRRERL
ncbi:MAG: hypothetical protein MJ070_09925, partial [Lachnospiraceae bacterium]|nr:hypothetical protein [Lachnospiraceae bacterium]